METAAVWGKLDPADNYLISSDGQVKSTWSGKEKLLKPAPNGDGYLHFGYYKDGKRTMLKVHRCVAIVFLGDRSEEGLYVLHKDGNKLNNNVDNLYWGTQYQNMKDRDIHETVAKGEKHGRAKLTEVDIYKIREHRSRGMTYREIAAVFGVSQQQIGDILNGKKWSHLLANA